MRGQQLEFRPGVVCEKLQFCGENRCPNFTNFFRDLALTAKAVAASCYNSHKVIQSKNFAAMNFKIIQLKFVSNFYFLC